MGMITVPRQPWSTMVQNAATLSLGNNTSFTTDAAGESGFMIGYARLSSGPGTSKSMSSSGSKVFWRTNTITFNNASTRFRVGIQPVSLSTYLETGTFDIYAELTSASGIASNTIYGTALTTGSKTVADGDLVAIGMEMTARGGSDSLQITGPLVTSQAFMGFPYRSVDSGSGPAKSGGGWISVAFQTDDGTLGWIEGAPWNGAPNGSGTGLSMSSAANPDEIGVSFQVAVPIRICAGMMAVSSMTTTDAGELAFYTTPFGTPAIPSPGTYTHSVVAAELWSGTANPGNFWMPITQYELAANTDYAFALRATTGTIALTVNDLGSGLSALKDVGSPFVPGTLKVIGRADQTGAFSEIDANYQPIFSIMIDGMHDGTGGGTNIFRQHASGHLRR